MEDAVLIQLSSGEEFAVVSLGRDSRVRSADKVVVAIRDSAVLLVRDTSKSAVTAALARTRMFGEPYTRWFNMLHVVTVSEREVVE